MRYSRLLFLLSATLGVASAGGQPPDDWAEVDRLISEQLYEAAVSRLDQIGAAAEKSGDDDATTRVLVRRTLLRTALHGYETAVRELKSAPWPETPRHRLVLELFYANALKSYVDAYSWEIRQRERVASDEEVDLGSWTLDQLHAEIQRAYKAAWDNRESWGAESLGDLGEYFEQNNYPARIRGTLRDAVSYLWVELLADTSLWRPEHSNEVYRLDLATLLADRVDLGVDADLADPGVHPLLKIAAVLADLEAWHRSEKRPEASFEARLERLQRLRDHFSRPEEQAALKAALEKRSAELGRSFPWWSMGRVFLAEIARGEDRPDAQIDALRLAQEGADAHPDSPGGLRCRQLAKSILEPTFDLAAMTSDGPGKRSIEVRHKDVETLHFRAYHLDLRKVATEGRDWNFLPDYRRVGEVVAGQKPDTEWTTELPPTPDHRLHTTWVSPPFDRPGLWVVAASTRRDFDQVGSQQAATYLVVGDLVLLWENADLTVKTLSGETGEALVGVRAALYRYDYRAGHQLVEESLSGDDGVVRFAVPKKASRESYFVVAQNGDDVAVAQRLQTPPPVVAREAEVQVLVYTDRSIYRPGQEILWKAVAYKADGDRFAVLPKAKLEVTLHDGNYKEVETVTVRTNEYGSASGSFDVPPGRLLGTWEIETTHGGRTAVLVEEYKRPTFEVTLGDPGDALKLNRPATLHGGARYYFGLPVTGGRVTWRVTREPVWLRPWYARIVPGPSREGQAIAQGTAELDDDGRFELTFTPEADPRLGDAKGLSYRYRLEVDVQDEGGETRSAERSFHLGFVAVEAAFVGVPGFVDAGQETEVEVRRTDLDGTPRAGKGRFRLLALAQPDEALLPGDEPVEVDDPYATPGDHLSPRWASYSPAVTLRRLADGDELAQGGVSHGEDGKARIVLPPLKPGAYRLRYTTDDAWGATFETATELVVAGAGDGRVALPAFLAAERTTVAAGETARVVVHSGLAGQEMELVIARGDEMERKRLVAGTKPEIVEIPVGKAERGGFSLRLALLRDHQLISLSERITVPWDDRRLQVELATFRDGRPRAEGDEIVLRPGSRETWTITLRGDDEKALAEGAAELLAYMFDRSLEFFAAHRPPDVVAQVYPTGGAFLSGVTSSLGRVGRVWSQSSSLGRPIQVPALLGDRLKSFDAYGIGGPGGRGRMMRSKGRVMESMMAAPEAASADMAEETISAATPPPPPPPPPPPASSEPVELRTDFAETAFWEPHLVLGDDGSASFEFTVPDSLTEWSIWVHGLTRDLRSGRFEGPARSVKELMVRPYVPRFFRAGDRMEMRVLVQNAGQETLAGTLDFDVVDAVTEKSLAADFGLGPDAQAAAFTVSPGDGTELVFNLRVPERLGTVAVRAVARSGAFSDGELRPLPVLPSRVHLVQSRFAALREGERRVLEFPDLAAGADPTLESDLLSVTVDAQLFYGALAALPYLVDYPYECTEQTLNRFVSTGILGSLYGQYPAVAKMAETLASRPTRYEAWEADDPNRRMTLEETPWMAAAAGGADDPKDLLRVLDPAVATVNRDVALAKLEEAQTSLGGFPWWPGGPPSPFMTLYILDGFSRALEFGAFVPREVIAQAWSYLHGYWQDDLRRKLLEKPCCVEVVTYLNYVLSSYPDVSWTGGVFTDDDRRAMLEYSLEHWREHSPRLKGYLSLTLARAGQGEEARKVFASVMDSAKTDPELGTFWAPEERAWLWYNDTIESHAFALRTLTELDPKDERRHGLVHWLFLNKELNHWKSTRATAEVLYALAHYLAGEGALGAREAVTVAAGDVRREFVFEPDVYTGGSNRLTIPGPEVTPETARIEVTKEGPGLAFAKATWHFSTEELPEEARGDFFTVERRYFRRVKKDREWVLEPLAEGAALAVGDQLEVELTLSAKHEAEYVHLRDPRPAGCEPERPTSGFRWELGLGFYEEVRDSGTSFFFEVLPVGEARLRYRLRASAAGTFRVAPATLQSMYAPEFAAYSSGVAIAISPP